jgi:hypothetical protein
VTTAASAPETVSLVDGRELGRTCQQLRRGDGSWNPDHGTWYFRHLGLLSHVVARHRQAQARRVSARSSSATESAAPCASDLLGLACGTCV